MEKADVLTLTAPAKINLTIEVKGKRNDGYHQICSILQAISLCDTLSFQPDQELRLSCSIPELSSPENSVLRAVRLLQEATGCSKGAKIELAKQIPEATGFGGHSSDAAAALLGLNQLWQLGLSHTELASLASKIGSDTTFFLYGGTALTEGRGEKITPLPSISPLWVVILVPPFPRMPRKTERLYASLTIAHFTSGQLTEQAAELIRQSKEIPPSLLFNVFENVAFDLFPGLSKYRQYFIESGANQVHLAGSGPALFALIKDGEEAEAVHRNLLQKDGQSYLARTLPAREVDYYNSAPSYWVRYE